MQLILTIQIDPWAPVSPLHLRYAHPRHVDWNKTCVGNVLLTPSNTSSLSIQQASEFVDLVIKPAMIRLTLQKVTELPHSGWKLL